jgi:hypothetical protein
MASVIHSTLYTAGYRDSVTDKRLPPELFYGSLPEEATVVDIRSHPYSPFAPDYTGSGVASAVDRWKHGVKEFIHLRALGNTHREGTGKRRTPPVYVDEERGFAELEALLRERRAVVIFCACSTLTFGDPRYRCHRFFVADEMDRRLRGLTITHLRITAVEDPNQGMSINTAPGG